MMTNSEAGMFIDTNIIFYASNFERYDVFAWLNAVYPQIIVHEAVLSEVRTTADRLKVQQYLMDGTWRLFEASSLSPVFRTVYNTRKDEITQAFLRLATNRREQGLTAKNTANIGEISILAACLMLNVGVICSNDFDVRTIVAQEQLTVFDDGLAQEKLIQQESVADFCVKVYQRKVATRKAVRTFYKAIIGISEHAQKQLELFDQRLAESRY